MHICGCQRPVRSEGAHMLRLQLRRTIECVNHLAPERPACLTAAACHTFCAPQVVAIALLSVMPLYTLYTRGPSALQVPRARPRCAYARSRWRSGSYCSHPPPGGGPKQCRMKACWRRLRRQVSSPAPGAASPPADWAKETQALKDVIAAQKRGLNKARIELAAIRRYVAAAKAANARKATYLRVAKAAPAASTATTASTAATPATATAEQATAAKAPASAPATTTASAPVAVAATPPGPTTEFKTCTAFGPSRRLEFPGGEDHNIRAEGGGWGSERSPKVTPLPRPLPPSPGTVSAYGATTFSACGALDAGLFGGVRGVDNMHRVSRLRTWGFGGLLSACRGRLGAEQGIGRRKEPLCVRVHQGAYASHSGSHYARCKVQQGRSKDESGGGCKGDYVMCALPGLQCGWQDVVCSVP